MTGSLTCHLAATRANKPHMRDFIPAQSRAGYAYAAGFLTAWAIMCLFLVIAALTLPT